MVQLLAALEATGLLDENEPIHHSPPFGPRDIAAPGVFHPGARFNEGAQTRRQTFEGVARRVIMEFFESAPSDHAAPVSEAVYLVDLKTGERVRAQRTKLQTVSTVTIDGSSIVYVAHRHHVRAPPVVTAEPPNSVSKKQIVDLRFAEFASHVKGLRNTALYLAKKTPITPRSVMVPRYGLNVQML
jgi:hypothetical protein